MSEDENSGLQQRIKKLGKDKREALARVAELEAAARETAERLAGYDALASRVASLEGDLVAAQQASKTTEALVGAGVTDARARRFLAYEYGQIEGERPEFGAWLETQRADSGFGGVLFGQASATAPAPAPAATPAPAESVEPVPAKVSTENGSRAHQASTGLSYEQYMDPSVSLADLNADFRARQGR